jgi:hypothetical protein
VLDVFKTKILRRIYGPVQDKGQWRSGYNKELYNLFKEPEFSITIRIARLRWAGHVRRMDVDYRTTENRETKGMEGGSWKGCDNVRNKELVVSYRVLEPMMMMMMVMMSCVL